MVKKRFFISAIGLCLAFLSLYIFFQRSFHEYEKEDIKKKDAVEALILPEKTVDARGSAFPASAAQNLGLNYSGKPKKPSRTTEALDAYNSRASGRKFAIEYWMRPEIGGQFYAAKLVDQCASLRANGRTLQAQPDSAEVGGANYLKALDALKAIQIRCGQLSDDELKKLSSAALVREKNAGGDIAMSEVENFRNALLSKKGSEIDIAIKRIVELGDPMVLDDIGMRLLLREDSSSGAYFYFDGKKFPLREEPLIATAIFLLPCMLGLNCAGDADLTLQARCLSTGVCFNDRYEQVVREMSGENGESSGAILEISRSIAAAIKNKDYGKLIEHSR